MNLRLIFRANQRSLKYPLAVGEYLVGSAPDCDVHLPHPTVSSRHARIRFDGRKAEITDLGSRNGTLVNFRRVDAAVTIGHGTELTLGAISGIVEAVSEGDLHPEVLLGRSMEAESIHGTVPIETLPRMAFGMERFFMEHLPFVLDSVLDGADVVEVAQQVGSRICQSLPITRLEILRTNEEGQAVAFSAKTPGGDCPRGAPTEVERGGLLLRAWSETTNDGHDYNFLLETAAQVIELADRPRTTESPSRPLKTPGAPNLPNPPTVDPYVQEVYRQAARVARGQISVLIQGESGTGKELLARYMHESSAMEKLIALNCAALPRDLLELELFGIERAVATGVEARPGKFEQADGGTLFLDEIGDMGLETQAKILRVLQEGEVYRLGSDQPRQARVRVIAATNREIDDMVRGGEFRRDLYHRIAAWVVELPPLRRRIDDIPNLAAYFLSQEARRQDLHAAGITRAAMEELTAHSWPGNIRELRSAIARACLFLEDGELVESQHLWRTLRRKMEGPPRTLKERINRFEKQQIEQALQATHGDAVSAAQRLGMSRATIYRRMKALGIQDSDKD